MSVVRAKRAVSGARRVMPGAQTRRRKLACCLGMEVLRQQHVGNIRRERRTKLTTAQVDNDQSALARMIKNKLKIMSGHCYLMKRADKGKPPPWWMQWQRRLSFLFLNDLINFAVVENLLAILYKQMVTPDQVKEYFGQRRFYGFRRFPRSVQRQVARALMTFEDKHDRVLTLTGALANPKFWGSLKVRQVITDAVRSGEFASLWNGTVFHPTLIERLVEADLLTAEYATALNTTLEPELMGVADELLDTSGLDWRQYAALISRAEAAEAARRNEAAVVDTGELTQLLIAAAHDRALADA